MRVLVCGGRDQTDMDYVFGSLDEISAKEQITELANGGAKGVDELSSQWAVKNRITLQVFPAKWNEFGKSAGIIRNIEMLDKFNPDLVIVFLRNSGRGTADMAARALKSNVRVLEIK